MCPHCGQPAPLVYRGVLAYCSGCGQLRGPLTGGSVTHAGSLSKAGGTVAKVFGWLVLAVGWALALVMFGLLSLVFGAATLAPYLIAGAIALIASTIAALSLWGGRSLRESGQKSAEDTREQAIYALAANHHGELRAIDLMQPLSVTRHDAELMLEAMAKKTPEDVSMEIDAQGGLYYVFPRYRQRIAVRVASEPGAAAAVEDAVGDPLVEQFEELERAERAKRNESS